MKPAVPSWMDGCPREPFSATPPGTSGGSPAQRALKLRECRIRDDERNETKPCGGAETVYGARREGGWLMTPVERNEEAVDGVRRRGPLRGGTREG